MDYQIIQAEIKDAQEILEIQKSAYQSEAEIYNDYDIPPLTQILDELKEQFKDHIILKAVSNDKIIGTVRAREKDGTCYIGRLAVLPDMQNKGIGQALLKEIERCFKPKRYELFSGCKSEKNLHLYQKHGYTIFKKDKNECGNIEIFHIEKMKTSDNGTPVCIRCFKPVDPLLHYCPHCGEATGQFTQYIPFVNLQWQASVWGRMWRQVWSRDLSFLGRLFHLLMIILNVPILLIGLFFKPAKESQDHQQNTPEHDASTPTPIKNQE